LPNILNIEGWYPPRSELSAGLYDVKALLEKYSLRVMKYQTDALGAISGALNALEVQHVWGVPLDIRRDETYPRTRLALLWHLSGAGGAHSNTRRPDFPGWTPIVRSASFQWATYDATIDGILLLDTPTSLTTVPWRFLEGLRRHETAPRYLKMVARVAVNLELIETFRAPDADRPASMLALPLNDDLDVILDTLWDISTAEILARGPIRGLVFRESGETAGFYDPTVILIQRGE
jgi:hypothetical protein